MLITGRFFVGLAGGAFCISSPLYGAEIAEKEIRGVIGVFLRVMMNSGILFIYLIGPCIGKVFWTNVICALITVVICFGFFIIPESPVYLVTEKRFDDAIKSYKWLRGDQYDPQHEIEELKEELELTTGNINFWEVLKMRATRMAMFIGFGLVTFQQLSGFNVVVFYSTDIFRSAQIELNPDISTIILGVINLGKKKLNAKNILRINFYS